ncbi:MAG: nickel-dependent lactate racemase [Proteobacteria bacterium]|nr:nickel-dependent lactate racemase [Pseudomonadota bacterium]MBU4382784.1 nickel-dependent lactate racemase [Pseudomonadota bacterium]MCG2765299.1 nickel-dependent lactate racemase [Desulfarculaceae bacterium]
MNFPKIVMVKNHIPGPEAVDVPFEVRRGLEALNLAAKVKPGQTVAITAGSRGVTDMAAAIAAVAAYFKELGAEPFVAPAMGSHGGATDQGQEDMLEHLGITQETIGAPVRSSMATETIGETSFGHPVVIGRDFVRADHVVVVNRVKPHTSFRGIVESGLCKMLTIGMGKHAGAKLAHSQFYQHGFEQVVREIAGVVMGEVPVICGVALVENHFERTAYLQVCGPREFMKTDAEMLEKARRLMGRVPFKQVDLLIVDEMGKNVSGSGMDSNVTGRVMNQVTPEPTERQFKRIFVRDLTPESEGNALGVGTADFTVRRLVEKIDLHKTRVNCITASVPEKGRIPLAYDDDKAAVTDALHTVGVDESSEARVVWIKNTLELGRMFVSQALVEEAEAMENITVEGDLADMPFDQGDNLPFGLFSR